MPIKPENAARYGTRKQWRAVVEQVRLRSFNRCEWPECGLMNGSWIIRYPDGRSEAAPENWFDKDFWEADGGRLVRVILTTAHLDHHPENCNLDNLRHWCQYHHLRYDAQHHAETARATREAKDLQIQPRLFTEGT